MSGFSRSETPAARLDDDAGREGELLAPDALPEAKPEQLRAAFVASAKAFLARARVQGETILESEGRLRLRPLPLLGSG